MTDNDHAPEQVLTDQRAQIKSQHVAVTVPQDGGHAVHVIRINAGYRDVM